MRKRHEPEYHAEDDAPVGDDGFAYDREVPYRRYTNDDFQEEYSDENEELDDLHRFHVAMNVFDLISVLAGLAVILMLVAILVSLLTWLQSDITQSFTLLTSQLQ